MSRRGGGGWWRPARNDFEAGSSRNGGCGGGRGGDGNGVHRSMPWGAARSPRAPPVPRSERRVNVSTETARIYAEAGAPLPWPAVHLPHGWHVNQARVPVPAIPLRGPNRRREILRRRAHLPPDLRRDPAYAVHSPLWERWFKAEHDARREMVEAHLEGLNDEDVDYEAAEAAYRQEQPPPPSRRGPPRRYDAPPPPPPPPVKEEPAEAEPWSPFPTSRHGDWVPAFPGHVYQQAAAEDPLEDDDDGEVEYEPADDDAADLTEDEAVERAMWLSLAEENAKWPLLDAVVQYTAQEAAAPPPPPPPQQEWLPPPLPLEGVWLPPQVFIDLGEED